MFSRDLLVTRKRRPYITPVYIHPEETGLAEKIIAIYQKGKSKGTIDEETVLLETHSTFKVVRGLSELLRRRTTFEAEYSIDPQALRSFLYKNGFVTTEEERNNLLVMASHEFGVPVEEIESSFWADRDEYQNVCCVSDISAPDLVREYNLSLTQTLLFDALSLEFTTTGNYQEILRSIKYMGLMYEIKTENDTMKIQVTGPVSLFKKTKKYGTSLAKIIPTIMKAPSWDIRAQIETEVAGEPRIYIFELSSSKKEFFPEVEEHTEHFDSAVEEDFVKRFSSLRKDWEIKREPTILKAGPSAMIPDFSLERRGEKCYIEIVGFWTPEYLKKKTEKVTSLNEEILLCVNKELQCTRKDFKTKNVDIIFYDKRVPMRPILDRIRKIESEQTKKEKEKLQSIHIELNGDVVSLQDIAEAHNVGIEAVQEILKKSEQGAVLKGTFVKNSVLEEVKIALEDLEDMRLSSVKKVLEGYGLNETVLKRLGFEVQWNTLDMEHATVKKVDTT